MHVDNKKKDILVLGEGPTKWLNNTAITAEAKYFINFTESGKRLWWVYTIMESTVSYLLMLQKYINSNQKILK